MISIDANILLYSFSAASPFHAPAKRFLEELSQREDVALSEFVLTEFYLFLRNPAVLQHPLDAPAAAAVISSYRKHPRWKTLGFPLSRELHDELWKQAATRDFARHRIYDTRTALSLTAFGVTDFATLNLKDFQDLGFKKVWNPLAAAGTGELEIES
jgi:predicted nucleic acid-binding protein